MCQLLPQRGRAAVVVTTPQAVAEADVARSLSFFRMLEIPILGLVENMAGFVCPDCGHMHEIFHGAAAAHLAAKFGVEVLARLPLDPRVGEAGDAGRPLVLAHPDSPATTSFTALAGRVVAKTNDARA